MGWDTGTVEILAPIRFDIDTSKNFRPQTSRITISTTDSTENISPDSSIVENGGTTVTWKVEDKLRLPVYSRYNSCLTLEITTGGVTRKLVALGLLWLKDIVDDEEIEVRIPVVVGKDLKQLRQNVINEETAKTHEYQIVGYMTTKLKLDSGLDEVSLQVPFPNSWIINLRQDHEIHAASQARRHAYET